MAKSKPMDETDAAKEDVADALDKVLEGFAEDPLAFSEDDESGDTSADLDGELQAALQERDEYKDRMMRALAEAENARKRADRDRRDAENYGGTRLGRDMLGVFDNLRRALDVIDDNVRETAPGLIEGIELTQKELLTVFAKHRIEKIEPEFGEKFDPQLHQAMFEAPVPGAPAGTVIQVMNVGFTIVDRLLRPAQVGVSSTPASQVAAAEGAEPPEPPEET